MSQDKTNEKMPDRETDNITRFFIMMQEINNAKADGIHPSRIRDVVIKRMKERGVL